MIDSDFELLPLALGWGKGIRSLDFGRCSCVEASRNQSATYKQKPWCSHPQEAKGAKPS